MATERVNDGFVGAQLKAGTHRIRLTYHTPGLTLGLVASGIGTVWLLLSAGLPAWRRRQSR